MSKFTSVRASGFGRTLDPFDARDGGPVRTDAGYHLERAALLPPSLRARTPLVQAVTAPPALPWAPRFTPRDSPSERSGADMSGAPAPGSLPPLAAGTPPVDVVVGGGGGGGTGGADSGTRFPFFVVGLLLAVYLVAKE